MKKTKILSLILVIVLMLCVLASCAPAGNVADSGKASIVIETKNTGSDKYLVYEVDLSLLESHNEGALSLLEYIGSQEGSSLYDSLNFGGGYGAYINSISPLYPAPNSAEYISIYTSEECDFSVPTEYFPTVSTAVYNGRTLTFSGVGISSMTIKDGTVILFRLESY